MTHNLKDPSLKVAIKVIDKMIMKDNMDQLMGEVASLNVVDHPNIVNHIEDYVDNRFVYIGKYLFPVACNDVVSSDGVY